MWQRFTPKAREAILEAQHLAMRDGHADVTGAHLLLGVMAIQSESDSPVRAMAVRGGLKWEELQLYAQAAIASESRAADAPIAAPAKQDALPLNQSRLTREAKRILELAAAEARGAALESIGTGHLFIACFRPQKQTDGIAQVLAPLGASAEQLGLHLRHIMQAQENRAAHLEHPLSRLTQSSQRALEAAQKAQRDSNSGRLSTAHLLLGVLENSENEAVAALETSLENVEELRQTARAQIKSDGQIAGPQTLFTPAAKRALDRAKANAMARNHKFIGPEDLLVGLLPAPLLLIERAQFGNAPDDPAATVLRGVDGETLRAIFAPPKIQNVKVAPQKANSAPVATRIISLTPFVVLLCLELALGISLKQSAPAGHMGRTLAVWLVGVLLVSGIAAVLTLLLSKNGKFKTAAMLAFGGAFAGSMVAMFVT